MRPAILLIAVAALLVGAAWNVDAVFDATVAVYQSGTFRQSFAIVCFAVAIAACIAALVLTCMHAERQVETDFPDHHRRSRFDWGAGPVVIDDDADVEVGGIGATDFETVRRQ